MDVDAAVNTQQGIVALVRSNVSKAVGELAQLACAIDGEGSGDTNRVCSLVANALERAATLGTAGYTGQAKQAVLDTLVEHTAVQKVSSKFLHPIAPRTLGRSIFAIHVSVEGEGMQTLGWSDLDVATGAALRARVFICDACAQAFEEVLACQARLESAQLKNALVLAKVHKMQGMCRARTERRAQGLTISYIRCVLCALRVPDCAGP